jgi:hypothetical protein
VAQLLVEAGALVGDPQAGTHLAKVAWEAGRSDVVSACRGHGADGVGVLLWAATRVCPGRLGTIVRHVDVNATDGAGDTALHIATRTRGCAANMVELLSLGANPRAVNMVGDTPLHAAAALGSSPNVSALIRGGADVTAVNRAGQTAREVAVGRGHLSLSFEKEGPVEARAVNVPSSWAMPAAGGPGAWRASSGPGTADRASAASGDAAATAWGASGLRPTTGALPSGPSAWPTGPVTSGSAASTLPGWGTGRSASHPWPV